VLDARPDRTVPSVVISGVAGGVLAVRWVEAVPCLGRNLDTNSGNFWITVVNHSYVFQQIEAVRCSDQVAPWGFKSPLGHRLLPLPSGESKLIPHALRALI
jgi:hypothetical protein